MKTNKQHKGILVSAVVCGAGAGLFFVKVLKDISNVSVTDIAVALLFLVCLQLCLGIGSLLSKE